MVTRGREWVPFVGLLPSEERAGPDWRMRIGISSWVIECCLTPPAVGDEVEWRLLFWERDPQDGDPTSLERLSCVASRLPDWDGQRFDRVPLLLTALSASLYWDSPQPKFGPVDLVGGVSIAQHGEAPDAVSPVRGRVARLQVAHTVYEEVPRGSRSWQPVEPLDVVYRDVDASPKWFHDEERLSDGRERCGNSLLVDLDLHGL